jgi:hypothetical protein
MRETEGNKLQQNEELQRFVTGALAIEKKY